MDLSAEIERKKKALAAAKAVAPSAAVVASSNGAKKYVRRGDLEAALVGGAAASASSSGAQLQSSEAHDSSAVHISEAEVRAGAEEGVEPPAKRRRVDAQQTEVEALPAQSCASAEADSTAARSSERSDAAPADAAHPSKEGSLAAATSSGTSGSSAPPPPALAALASSAASSASSSAAPKPHTSKPKSVSRDALAHRDAPDGAWVYQYKFWKGLLNEWRAQLDDKGEAFLGSAAGRATEKLWEQAKEQMGPFFEALKHKAVSDGVMALLKQVVDACLERDYRAAGEAYVNFSIGKAAWPIGVSAVGLHERAARQRVSEGKQAHLMNDEATRKYVTSIKRLMSVCQETYPNEDPSKMMRC